MRILILHSRYLSGDASGENQVVSSEASVLRQAGHDVRVWTPEPAAGGRVDIIRTAAQAIHSRSSARYVRMLVRQHDAEVVHCHNLFPVLSPSVLSVAADEGAAVVMTLHNYRLLCLPATFLRDGRICEACVGRAPWPGVVHACYRGSRPGSAALAGSLVTHRAAGTFARVRRFLAVSGFVRKKYVDAGFPDGRVLVKPNFAFDPPPLRRTRSYHLYLGRLSAEKGVATLLEAHRAEHGPLLIVGDGPERHRLRSLAGMGVEFAGHVSAEAVPKLLAGARSLLVPSRSYEGAPRAVLEAYASGVPVVGSQIGGISELVEDGVSGLLVPPDDTVAWSTALTRLTSDNESQKLGAGARTLWEKRYGPDDAVRALEHAYREALAHRSV